MFFPKARMLSIYFMREETKITANITLMPNYTAEFLNKPNVPLPSNCTVPVDKKSPYLGEFKFEGQRIVYKGQNDCRTQLLGRFSFS